MIKAAAVYPNQIDEEYAEKVIGTVRLAAQHGFDEIFTTLHLPEFSLQQQISCYQLIADEAMKRKLEVTVDVGGRIIDDILENAEYLDMLSRLRPSYIRLDYGYDFRQVRKMHEQLGVNGFIINASMYDEDQIAQQLECFREIDPGISIRACHNFYPREESGLDEGFALRQDEYFRKYGIPVYYFIPTHSNPRGPLHKGLTTIESHRNASLRSVLCDLYLNYRISAFMMADEWLSKEEFSEIDDTLKLLECPLEKLIRIPVTFMENTSEEERRIVLHKHVFRYDSSSAVLRSRSSRQMAEFAGKISKNNTFERKAGSITIDNSLYQRYSGELQVGLKDMKADERVNVVAKLNDRDDLIRLARFREGIEFEFVENR